jgi:hypothetical protein
MGTLLQTMNVYNVNEVMIYDELQWDDSIFSSHSVAIDILQNRYDDIRAIIFYNLDDMIEFDMKAQSLSKFYFHNLTAHLLNDMAHYKALQMAIKHYCLRSKLRIGFNTYPLLSTIILGKHE